MRSSNLLMLLAVVLLSGVAGRVEAFDLHDIRLLRDSGYRSCRGCDLREANLRDADLSGAQLQNANLFQAQLQSADLVRAQLQGADLSAAQLQDADLSAAQLQKANLWNSQLQNARLEGANLHGAYLWHAQLQNADLRDAQLQNANLSHAQLRNAILWNAQLQNAILAGAQLQNARLEGANLHGAYLWRAQLQDADLVDAQLQNAILWYAQLRNANLRSAQLQNANLRSAQLRNANLSGAQLQNADLRDAQLQGAHLVGSSIEGAKLAFSDLTKVTYAPASPPPDRFVEGIKGLSTLHVPYDEGTQQALVSGLVLLRELLQTTGLRDLEREATFSIERAKTHHALNRWRERPLRAAEGVARLIFFEWPVAYGLRPWRALQLLLGLILLLSFAYLPAIGRTARSQGRRGAIYQIWPNERLIDDSDGIRLATYGDIPERLRAHRLKAKSLIGQYGYALYFSLLSAFHLGWRELNVGTWLARMQRQEYTLRALGWPRVLSGLQSLISVYLVAIWALTYFGRPFQ